MVYRKEVNAQSVELEVSGDLNQDMVNEFRAAIYGELDGPKRQINLDLREVRTINSAAIGAILLFQKKADEKGKKLMISKISNEVRTTFVAIHLDRLLTIAG